MYEEIMNTIEKDTGGHRPDYFEQVSVTKTTILHNDGSESRGLRIYGVVHSKGEYVHTMILWNSQTKKVVRWGNPWKQESDRWSE